MKNNILFIAIMLSLQACQQQSSKNDQRPLHKPHTADSVYSRFIPIDSANRMLSSYLSSISYPNNDTDIQSLVIDAHQLKRYINSAPDEITSFKLMFAHKLDYINAGYGGIYAGYKRNALTLIIAGCNDSGDYVYINNNQVLNYSSPCPPGCPPNDAGSPLLTQ